MFRKAIEWLLWSVAIVSLSVYGYTVAERWLYQTYADSEFEQMLAGIAKSPSPEHHTTAPQSPEEPLGRLEIPSINFAAIVVEGTEDADLRRGVGHIAGTAVPGSTGNIGLAGHRDTFFRRLGEIRYGDPISFTTLRGTFEYVVDSIQIVDSDEAIVLHDVGQPVLTLVTCYPFRYVGAAPKRFIVHASLVTE